MATLIPTPQARQLFDASGLTGDLRRAYLSMDHPADDLELFALIESRFHDRLLRDVCRPLNLRSGACVRLAMALAREPDE